MRPPRLGTAFALASIWLGWSAAPALGAWAHDPALNTPLSTGSASRFTPVAVSDGAGGMFVAWSDNRLGTYDIYVQHVDAAGRKLWGASDVPVCTAATNQSAPVICSDGLGGAIVAWIDPRNGNIDVFVRRVNSAGVPQWAIDGVAVCTAGTDQTNIAIASDRAGGCVLAWRDARNGNFDIYAARVQAAGNTFWTANGAPVCTQVSSQSPPLILYDPIALSTNVVWQDLRTDAGDIYMQRLDSAGNPILALNGVGLAVFANEQREPVLVEDNAQGFLVAWIDDRSGVNTRDLYAQRFNANGSPYWAAAGVALCTAAGQADAPTIVTDGQSGAIVAWADTRSGVPDIYARRISAGGTAMWAADGVALCAAQFGQIGVKAAADGLGGVIATWQDFRLLGQYDVYAQRINAAGAIQWPTDGVGASTAPGDQNGQVIVPDGSVGAIVTFVDFRTNYYNLYMQHVDRWGYLGGEPIVTSVRDVPNDQGGLVKVSWNASPLDMDPAFYNVTEYLLFRSAPPNVVGSAMSGGAITTSVDEAAASLEGEPKLLTTSSTAGYAWEYLATQGAFHLPAYSMLAATPGDSVAGSYPRTAFMVLARNAGGTQFWSSEPDSGYSVDNLAPAPPAPFTGQYQGALTRLHWSPNAEPDLAGYRLYRGSSPSFTPGPANLVASPPDTGYVDAAGAPYVYKLAAVDTHGNESGYALLTPSGTTGDDAVWAGQLALAIPHPNPASDAARIGYSLGVEGDVELAIVDVSGRLVRQLVKGRQLYGPYSVRWDGADEHGGPAPAGVYFVRLAAEGRVLMRRLAFLK